MEKKLYRVTYWVKKGHFGGGEHEENQIVEASNSVEACKIVRKLCRDEKGFNVFRPRAIRV